MGLAASNGRLIYLTAYQSDLEFKEQLISNKRYELAWAAAEDAALREKAKTDPNVAIPPTTPEQYHLYDTALMTQITQLQTQHKMVTAEYESVKKTMDQNIERTFKYNA